MFLFILINFNYSCNEEENKKIPVINKIIEFDKSKPEVWWQEQLFKMPQKDPILNNLTEENIENIFRILDVDRWNNYGDIGGRYKANYTEIAEKNKININILKEVDHYVYYVKMDFINKLAKIFSPIIRKL